ncbi:hypothetical protein SM124_15300 [Bacillus sp. 31A1R]|uniref:Tyrosinase copper-binding domain-containing protein n=1 Tax=Robertmurraya mangrovi TaxID=3098077 RepID=A0ABU5J109_9BACI|nr:hypothetical protein [Bacillus sp. 31A1R]MDZ5473084.1 hypothetical protein [Bacillus sp. 31A1R]
MASIENFPQNLLDEHAEWHRNMRMDDFRAGDGLDFLQFHRDFLRKSLRWYRNQGLDTRLVQPWRAIPSDLKNHPRWGRELLEAENRIVNSPESFRSSDELGIYLQSTSLHDAVHVLGAEVYNDPDFSLIFLSPRSTYFYNWHGLIDQWYSNVEHL